MLRKCLAGPCLLLIAVAACAISTGSSSFPATEALSSSGKPKRPIVSLTGSGDVSKFLYGKLQRATSLYGSGLVGPATAVVHGDKDTRELLPKPVVASSSRDQRKDLDDMLWKQFGMATCEGIVEREDLLTKMSYLKPRLADLQDTVLFLDATTSGMGKNSAGSGETGLGGLLSGFLGGGSKPKPNSTPKNKPRSNKKKKSMQSDCWVDVDLVRSAMSRGSRVFVVCESSDTTRCAKALNKCISAMDGDNSIVTLVSPEDGTILGGNEGEDTAWKSLRPQDLEGELLQAVSVRRDPVAERRGGGPSGDNGSRARLAAASADYIATDSAKGLPLSRQDLAEVCVQCALRLPTTPPAPTEEPGTDVDADTGSAPTGTPTLRVVRVIPRGTERAARDGIDWTERPNKNYFAMMGGKKAKAREGTVASADWARTLEPLVDGGSIRVFPKRPSEM
ncbi:unnamed protein product [Pseudo-nitzschia multistriata]|uniref:Uncharacterized protein n=1 Tax=Pseudo-nitzschia multistriata TaxID=183589 RepID=A0A448YWH6_9STRA|nr:unnamed protein product [Pseudo-nitzschia multistriata]